MTDNRHDPRQRQIAAIALFALILTIVPTLQILMCGWPDLSREMEEQSVLQRPMTGLQQQVLTGLLHSGNEQAVVGENGELHYIKDIHYLTTPIHPEAATTIADLAHQLKERDITLVVVPVPVKAQFQKEGTMQNSGYEALKGRLKEAGVKVFDPLSCLKEKNSYLCTDTHWRPEAMEHVAQKLAHYLQEEAECPLGSTFYRSTEETLTQHGDIYTMLKLWKPLDWLPQEEVTIHPVLNERGEFWQSEPEAEILFMGDSFSNIYSLQGMGWGMSAGLTEHLSAQLQQPITALRRNDEGSIATRRMLQRQLAQGHDILEGKRIVVWEFAVRELTQGDWSPLDMKLNTSPRPSTFLTLNGDEKRTIKGTIESMSAIPSPKEITYADHVVALHLTDIGEQSEQALVYALAIENRQLTPAAYLRPGDEVTLEVESWEKHEATEGAYNRNELDDPYLLLEQPVWANEIKRNN